jgi:asparagine synthase (glutamine-hydrolysing)
MKLAQPKVKVLLDGQGGDELLGGYFLFWHVYLKSMLLKSPFQFFKDVYKISQINSVNPLIFIARALVPYCGIQLGRNIKTRFDSIFTSDFRTYGERFKKEFFSGEDIFGEPVKNIMFNALRSFMLPNLLRNEDRISMAFSLESRLPFLDYRIIEFCFAMPTSMKFKGAVSKALLRDTMQGVVNSKILNRFDKMGFPTPAKRWYRQYHKDEIMDIIESEEFRTRGIFDTKRIRIFIKGFFDGRYDINSEISRIIMLDIWFRLFIEN